MQSLSRTRERSICTRDNVLMSAAVDTQRARSTAEATAAWKAALKTIVDRWSGEIDARKQLRSRRRARELLRAALRIFARDGISRARIGDIASEAGMPISSLYDYFPSKQELAYAVPLEHLAQFFREYQAQVAAVKTFRERLRLYLWLAGDYARRNPEWARTLYLEIWPSVLVSETRLRHIIDDFARIVVDIIRSGELAGEWSIPGDAHETASILVGSVNQVIIVWLLYRKPHNLMRAIASVSARSMTLLVTPASAVTRPRPRVPRVD